MSFNGAKTVLVSGGFSFLTNYLKEDLGFHYAHGNNLEISKKNEIQQLTGKVTYPIIGKDAKLHYLKKYTKKYNFNMNNTICVGDGANDIEMIKNAGLGVSFNGKDILDKAANIQFNYTNLKGLLYAQGIAEKDVIK
jgi:phosphoserine phosphatase